MKSSRPLPRGREIAERNRNRLLRTASRGARRSRHIARPDCPSRRSGRAQKILQSPVFAVDHPIRLKTMKDTLKPGLTHTFQFKIPANKTVPHLYPESD